MWNLEVFAKAKRMISKHGTKPETYLEQNHQYQIALIWFVIIKTQKQLESVTFWANNLPLFDDDKTNRLLTKIQGGENSPSNYAIIKKTQ